MSNQCEFCMLEHSNNPILPDYLQDIPVGNLHQSVIYCGKHFWVKPDISPLVQDHLLIIPKEHLFCINDLPSIYKKEIGIIKERIIQYYQKKGMSYLFFEHGCCTEKELGSSCIHHAHLHAIPITQKDEKVFFKRIFDIIGLPNATSESVKGKPYLFLESSNFPYGYWFDIIERSQLFRIIISDIMGNCKRARWQNCLIDETERIRSEKWLEKYKNFILP